MCVACVVRALAVCCVCGVCVCCPCVVRVRPVLDQCGARGAPNYLRIKEKSHKATRIYGD